MCVRGKILVNALLLVMGLLAWLVQGVSAEFVLGSSLEQVVAEMGEPRGRMALGRKLILTYPEGDIVLEGGKVVEIGITAQSRAAAEEQKKQEAYRKAQQAKGLIEFEGQWLTSAEKDKIVKARLKAAFPAGRITLHECAWAGQESIPQVPAGGQPAAGTYHYAIYVPHDYYQDESRRYPCMFVAAPDGYATMNNMEMVMLSERWIVVMLQESRNEAGWPVMAGNFVAAHDDVVAKLRTLDGMKFAAGFSGGARAATLFATLRTGFAGLILQGAGFWYTLQEGRQTACLQVNPALLVCAVFGVEDQNIQEAPFLEQQIPPARRWIKSFSGGHVWAPPEVMALALEWLEQTLIGDVPSARRAPEVDRWYRENQHAKKNKIQITYPER